MDNKDLVRTALTEIFIKKNFDAADEYIAQDYPEPYIGMEVFRVENGQLAEFWGLFQPETSPNGNAMFPIQDK